MASESLQLWFKCGAVPDLKSAHDRVPTDRLLELCRRRLDPDLCDMIQCLLHRTAIRTKGQLGNSVAHTILCVPRGDKFSPWLLMSLLTPSWWKSMDYPTHVALASQSMSWDSHAPGRTFTVSSR